MRPEDGTAGAKIYVNNSYKGRAQMIRTNYQVGDEQSWPEVAVLYAGGYVRLKPARDPDTPFGTSFILGPAYWSSADQYFHNPTLKTIRIDTGRIDPETGRGPLTFRIIGINGGLKTRYRLNLNAPSTRSIKMNVTQTQLAGQDLSISRSRQQSHEGFKIVQFSSMYVDENYHDSDSAQYVDINDQTLTTPLTNQNQSIFNNPLRMGQRWLKIVHSDRSGWQGATPSSKVALRTDDLANRSTPQGWVTQSSNWNDDNVGLWINNDQERVDWNKDDRSTVKYNLFSYLQD